MLLFLERDLENVPLKLECNRMYRIHWQLCLAWFQKNSLSLSHLQKTVRFPNLLKMSLRSAVIRAPAKRMLVYFEEDSSTSILSTNKVKKILDGNKLEDGVAVLVDYDNVDYEALVIKLHGKYQKIYM